MGELTTLRHGRYVIERELGRGGEGCVVLARDLLLGRRVVLKWRLESDDVSSRKLLEEWTRLASVDHPAVVAVEEAFVDPSIGGPVLVEPWEEGESLGEQASRLTRSELLRIAWQLIDGLAFLHGSGIRHGDVKPANVIVEGAGERVRASLIDFGLAAAVDDPELQGATAAYLAPEVARGRSPGAASDWFALGLTIEQVSRGAKQPLMAPKTDVLPNRDALDRLVLELLQPDLTIRLAAVDVLLRHRLDAPASAELARRFPFVGRRECLAAVEREIAGASVGARLSPIVRVSGARGSGRTRLLQELYRRSSSRGEAVVFLDSPFSPERLADELAIATGVPLARSRARRQAGSSSGLFEIPGRGGGLARELARQSKRPTLIMIGSRAADCPVARSLVRGVESGASILGAAALSVVLVIGVPEDDDADSVSLSALETADVTELLARLFGLRAEDELGEAGRAAGRIHEMANGRPEAVSTLVRAAYQAGWIDFVEGRWQFDERGFVREATIPSMATDSLSFQSADEEAVWMAFIDNFGSLDRAAIVELTDLPLAGVTRALESMAAAGLISRSHFDREPIAVLRDFGASATSGSMEWSSSSPIRDRVGITDRVKHIVDRFEPWLRSSHPAALVPHLSRARGSLGFDPAVSPLLLLETRALMRAERLDEAALRLGEARLHHFEGSDGAELVMLAASVALARGRPDEAAGLIEEALENSCNPEAQGRFLSLLSYAELLRGHVARAASLATSASEDSTEDSDRARALTMQGASEQRMGQAESARAALREAERLWRRVGDRAGLGACLANLGALERQEGHLAEALRLGQAAVVELDAAGADDQLAAALTNLGVAWSECRRFETAARCHSEARRIFALGGNRARGVAALASRGIARFGAGSIVAARRDLVAASRIFADELATDPRTRLLIAVYLGRIERCSGRRGRRRLQECRRIMSAEDSEEATGVLKREASRHGIERLEESSTPADSSTAAAVAARLRRPESEERGQALLDAVALRFEQGRCVDARRFLSRVFRLVSTMEQGMSQRSKSVFRAMVVNRELSALERRLTSRLENHEGAAGVGLEHGLELLHAIHGAPDLEAALEAVIAGVIGLIPVERVFIVRAGEGRGYEFLASGRRDGQPLARPEDEISHKVIEEVLESRRAIVLADASADSRFGFAMSVQKLGLRSIAAVPLRSGRRFLGLLYVDSPMRSGVFDSSTVAVLEGLAELATTALALRLGADRDLDAVRDELESQSLELVTRSRELARARERLGEGHIIGRSAAIESVNALIDKVAPTSLSVIVQGETGTGKELVAQALHRRSPRRSRAFVTLNCAALPESLAESELFGHVRGSFTGAVADEPGLFRLASGGTIFLDEIGELSAAVQAKLLRVLETGRVRPVGGDREREIDVRVIAATNRDLRDFERFRSDLYFRLAGVVLGLPPLRDRRDDIPLLLRHFAERAGRENLVVEPMALEALVEFDWPGNVRELRNTVERLMLLSAEIGQLRLSDLPPEIWDHRGEEPVTLAETESRAIRVAMRYAGGEKKAAARLLGISRTTLYQKLEKIGPGLA